MSVSDFDLSRQLEGMVQTQAWGRVREELQKAVAIADEELTAMGTDAKRRDELAGYRAGILLALEAPREIIENLRSERGVDDL